MEKLAATSSVSPREAVKTGALSATPKMAASHTASQKVAAHLLQVLRLGCDPA
jgi:hypothetical protein